MDKKHRERTYRGKRRGIGINRDMNTETEAHGEKPGEINRHTNRDRNKDKVANILRRYMGRDLERYIGRPCT